MVRELNFQAYQEDRLPPQNIEAEESILGGILLDPEAIARVREVLVAEAFYIGAHRDIFNAAQWLHERGQPTDLIGVTAWLQDRNLLGKIGGQSKLAQLVERTVSAVNIDQYAALVMDKYLRRQLIKAGYEIHQLGYETSSQLDIVLDRAEQTIFGVTQKRPQRDFVSLENTLVHAFHEIELRNEEQALPGLLSSFYDLDAMTGGFQRSDLIIIAGRPSMGKTAVSLNIAHQIAARYRLPVAVFSLEMSKEQLVQRLLASEAGIESQRLRSGRISQNEWEPLSHAIGTLSELPIFIDDTANLTVTEMRSKSRRLMAERGGEMGCIVLDYLQLMEGSGSDNRVQELSRITRSLKGLARELDVPVIALSQLSRGVEARNNKRPMLSDLRESGCLAGDSLVTLADCGIRVPIRELVGKSGFTVWALNEATLQLEKAVVSRAFATGVKPVFQLKTRLGRTIRATGNHKFRTLSGWKRLDELQVSERVALPRIVPSPSERSSDDARLALLGHLLGDGCTLPRHAIQYTTKEEDLAQLVVAHCGTTLYKQNVSRDRAARLATVVRSEEIERLANSDIYWDEIVSIEADGMEEVYDLTVPNLHNFIANDIIVHNSIEQDADVVIMVYRDEYYFPDSPDRGITELIVTKHRNGPTGVVKLLFDPQYTRFRNMVNRER
ncbi:MAG TPA: replicative DNA helicase [Oscillatoriales cyanobacterium M59_W2019_021]|nr:MAG: replicative DNA helicase [Cyanobacteria bacterium J055]HIK30795.1 replicative DNA helicase [Oscillatoriales cyanobacterium M4454_W2019_049]HIK50813.1 replicative DNA helicase [Oscillatoriales cyanobacterium M59_W2019_021]